MAKLVEGGCPRLTTTGGRGIESDGYSPAIEEASRQLPVPAGSSLKLTKLTPRLSEAARADLLLVLGGYLLMAVIVRQVGWWVGGWVGGWVDASPCGRERGVVTAALLPLPPRL